MKKQLEKVSGIKPLSRNTKLHADGIYVLSSESAAQNVYFETKRDIIRAHKLMNKHLLQGMCIIDYLFTSDGWVLVVETKSTKDILGNVKRRGYNSDKMKAAIKRNNVSIIISELIRYVISGIARITNSRAKRLGSFVRRNFSRYIFSSTESVEKIMRLMKKEQLMLCHQRKRYRPSVKWSKMLQGVTGKGDVYLCTKSLVGVGDKRVNTLQLTDLNWNVLRDVINRVKKHHDPPNSSILI